MSGFHARVTFLGTGTSHGVPAIGCGCVTCRSTDPRDRRWRPSILIEIDGGATILVDTSPDLRAQALAFGFTRIDAILFTHAHADHLLGLDDIRRFNDLQGAPIPCYGNRRTLKEIRRTFAYAFRPGPYGGGIPRVNLFPVEGAFSLAGVEIVPVPVMHGTEQILGFRFGPFAYLTDCSAIPEASRALLDGVRHLAIDALRERPHPTHFSLSEALEFIGQLKPAHAWLTHICHDLGHAATSARLPVGVELAYDGLRVEVTG
ncbi:MAG: MBL fold metallo-hydrolase [Acidobacteria bacterium]|nr:MBL fold metallo-hydrolase [Acidobacteriota bacterium]